MISLFTNKYDHTSESDSTPEPEPPDTSYQRFNPAVDQQPGVVQNLNQPSLKKNDRVTFFNDRTNRWTVATITSGPNKYYIKHGNYHNFRTDDKKRGTLF